MPLRVTVTIATFKRPDFLERSVRSVLAQTRPADEVMVVHRSDDFETMATFEHLRHLPGSEIIRFLPVGEPGVLPPVRKAIENCESDVIAFIDDDATAHTDWLERLIAFYSDSAVGGVGGRIVDYQQGELKRHSPVSVAGKLHRYGRFVGNMYREFLPNRPVDADCFMGGNMSYRVRLIRDCPPDRRLSSDVSFYWELDVALKVKAEGYRLIYEPRAKVDHYSAARAVQGLRSFNYDGLYWSNYNYAFIMMRHLNWMRRIAYLGYSLLIGEGTSPGLAKAVQLWMRGTARLPELISASFSGRLAGVREGLRAAREA